MTDIKVPLGIIDPNNLKKDERFLLDITYEMFPDKEVKLFLKEECLVFWCDYYCIFEKARAQTQEEFPLESLPWFVRVIEERFWRYKVRSTDRPGDVSESVIINGETIGINPVRHCCAENLPGYSFWNKSRKSYISNVTPQQRSIPKYMLENGLLDDLKRITLKLGMKL